MPRAIDDIIRDLELPTATPADVGYKLKTVLDGTAGAIQDQLKIVSEDIVIGAELIVASAKIGLERGEILFGNMSAALQRMGQTQDQIDASLRELRAKNAAILESKFTALAEMKASLKAHLEGFHSAGDKKSSFEAKKESHDEAKKALKDSLEAFYSPAEATAGVTAIEANAGFRFLNPNNPMTDPDVEAAVAELAARVHAAAPVGSRMKAESAPGPMQMAFTMPLRVWLTSQRLARPDISVKYGLSMLPAMVKRVPANFAAIKADPRQITTLGAGSRVRVFTSVGSVYHIVLTGAATDIPQALLREVSTDPTVNPAPSQIMFVDYVIQDDLKTLLAQMDVQDTISFRTCEDIDLSAIAPGSKIDGGVEIVLKGCGMADADPDDFEVEQINGAAPHSAPVAQAVHDAIKANYNRYVPMNFRPTFPDRPVPTP